VPIARCFLAGTAPQADQGAGMTWRTRLCSEHFFYSLTMPTVTLFSPNERPSQTFRTSVLPCLLRNFCHTESKVNRPLLATRFSDNRALLV